MIIFKAHETVNVVARYLPDNPIIVEAGAYIGTDTIKIAQQWPHGVVHAFEPVPDIFARLQENTQPYPNIYIYQQALSDKNGTASIYIAEKKEKPGISTQASSLHAPKERLHLSPIIFPRTITVHTMTLNTWAHQHNIAHVDMLWLDLQGHELAVLQAADAILSTVSVILIEVAFVQAYEEQPTVEQVIAWMQQTHFVCVGRDFIDQHQWFFGNLLFVRSKIKSLSESMHL